MSVYERLKLLKPDLDQDKVAAVEKICKPYIFMDEDGTELEIRWSHGHIDIVLMFDLETGKISEEYAIANKLDRNDYVEIQCGSY